MSALGGKLAAVLGMLGSDHDGEIVAAARQAERLRRTAGLTWADIIMPAFQAPTRRREIETVAEAIAYALDFAEVLTRWEQSFVSTLGKQRTPVSPKQIAILEKVRRAEAKAAA